MSSSTWVWSGEGQVFSLVLGSWFEFWVVGQIFIGERGKREVLNFPTSQPFEFGVLTFDCVHMKKNKKLGASGGSQNMLKLVHLAEQFPSCPTSKNNMKNEVFKLASV